MPLKLLTSILCYKRYSRRFIVVVHINMKILELNEKLCDNTFPFETKGIRLVLEHN